MYGDQQTMKTITMTKVIFTVFTLARGIIPRLLALRAVLLPKPARSAYGINIEPLAHIVFTMMA